MDIILFQRAGGHAPHVVPADVRRRAMKRDGVADEHDAHAAVLLHGCLSRRGVHLCRIVLLCVGLSCHDSDDGLLLLLRTTNSHQ